MAVKLPLYTSPEGASLFRCHKWPAQGEPDLSLVLQGRKSAWWRFDDPRRVYDVVYLAVHPFGAWAETTRAPGGAVARALCAATGLAVITVQRPLRLVDLSGHGLAMLGHTAELACFTPRDPPPGYQASQRLSRDLYDQLPDLDGLLYRCRHDASELAVAIFVRGVSRMRVASTRQLDRDPRWVQTCLTRYGQGLTP